MFRTSKIARLTTLVLAITIIASLLPVKTVSGQSTVQTPAIGIWISAQELASLPTSGSAWTSLMNAANASAGSPDIQNQDSDNDVYVLAKALVYARTGNSTYRSQVVSALKAAVNTENGGRTLALGRNLVSYVIAADLVNLPAADSSFNSTFTSWLRSTLTETLDSKTLISTHEERPNNWGTHAGASRAAVAWYIGDRAQLDRTAQVFRGWLGDRSAYAGFEYGDLAWQCNPSAPVGVNPKGCTKNGVNIDGALPDDMRRGGGFTNPPTFTDYAWEAMQGVVVQALILQRAGYPALSWSDNAVFRASDYLYRIGWKPSGDDAWQPWLLNYAYGTNYGTSTAGRGKNMGWTDWTHGGRRLGAALPPAPTAQPPAPTAQPQPTLAPTTQAPAPTAQPQPTLAPTQAPTALPQPTIAPVSGGTLKSITFESGKITDGNNGVDRTSGSPSLVSSGALSGSYSLGINSSSAYVQEDFNNADEIFVSFLLQLKSIPGSNTRILFFSNNGDTTANIVLNNDGSLKLRVGSSSIGSDSSKLATNTVYRVGLYQKRGSGGNAIAMAYLAPAGQAFSSPFAAVTNGSWTGQATFMRFGATAGSSVNVVFDDLNLSTTFVP